MLALHFLQGISIAACALWLLAFAYTVRYLPLSNGRKPTLMVLTGLCFISGMQSILLLSVALDESATTWRIFAVRITNIVAAVLILHYGWFMRYRYKGGKHDAANQ